MDSSIIDQRLTEGKNQVDGISVNIDMQVTALGNDSLIQKDSREGEPSDLPSLMPQVKQ